MDLSPEIRGNMNRFVAANAAQREAAVVALSAAAPEFSESYFYLSMLNGWTSLINSTTPEIDKQGFLREAQNDAIVSHCLARDGLWRPALQALRSCIENGCAAMFYKDHPIEYRLWTSGRLKYAFAKLTEYLEHHPDIAPIGAKVSGIEDLIREYETLSRAVHGSSESFRMTSQGTVPSLWSSDVPSARKWHARERPVMLGLLSLFCALYAKELQGTRNRSLREQMGSVFPASRVAALRRDLAVILPKPANPGGK